MTSGRISTLDPAPPQPREGGGGGRWAWLVTASGIVEAELIRGLLETDGIPCVLDRRDSSPFAWMYLAGNVNASIQVYVPASLLDPARFRLIEAGFDAEPAPPAEPAQGSRSWVKPILAVSGLLVAIWILIVTYLGSASCTLRLVC
jgi:hypothetical protein